jgi:hypothetical protein
LLIDILLIKGDSKMYHHLKHSLIVSSRDFINTSNSLEHSLLVYRDTVNNPEYMDYWKTVFDNMKNFEADIYGVKIPKNTIPVSAIPANNTMKPGRHSLPFKDINNRTCYLDCMSSIYRKLYSRYTDSMPLAPIVAGLLSESEDGFVKSHNKLYEYHSNELGESLSWYKNHLKENLENKMDYSFKVSIQFILDDLKELNGIIKETFNIIGTDDLSKEIKELEKTKESNLSVEKKQEKSFEILNEVKERLEKIINDLKLDEKKVNDYVFDSFNNESNKKKIKRPKIK